MAAGQAECGISFQDALTFAAAAGAPIVSVMAILQHTAQEIAVLDSSSITRPRQLDGKTYAGFGYPNEEPTLKSVIKADGGKGTFTTVTLDTAAYEALYAKRADFVITFAAWEGIEAERARDQAADVPVRRLRLPGLLPGRPRLRQPLAGVAPRPRPRVRRRDRPRVRGRRRRPDEGAAAMLVSRRTRASSTVRPSCPPPASSSSPRAATCATRTARSVARRSPNGRAIPASCSTRGCWPVRTASRSRPRPTTGRCSRTTSCRDDRAAASSAAGDRRSSWSRLLVLAWEAYVRLAGLDPITLPPPSRVVGAAVGLPRGRGRPPRPDPRRGAHRMRRLGRPGRR